MLCAKRRENWRTSCDARRDFVMISIRLLRMVIIYLWSFSPKSQTWDPKATVVSPIDWEVPNLEAFLTLDYDCMALPVVTISRDDLDSC